MATELITNGSFEIGTGINPTGWTGSGPARVDSTPGLAADGASWYTLSADTINHGGAVSQTISTVAGTTYTLTFKAGIGWQPTTTGKFDATMKVDMLNGATLIKSGPVELSGNSSVGWGTYTLTFTAMGPQTTLRFTDTSPNGQADFDVGLDKVSVQESPAANTAGAWGDVQSWPLIPIHSVVTQDGKVLTFGTNLTGGQGAAMYHDLYDPVTKTHQTIDHTMHTPTDIFCSAAIIIPGTDKIMISGGDARPLGAANSPVNDSNYFSTTSHQVLSSPEGEMTVPRWYNTMVSLATGQIVNLGGMGAGGVVEIFTEGEGWRVLPGAKDPEVAASWYYPRAWVANSGEIIYFAAGGGTNSVIEVMALNPAGLGSLRKVGELPFSTDGTLPSIMYEVGKALVMASNGEMWTMDITGATPKFAKVGLADQDRNYSNMTLLADGKVLVNGGTSSGNAESASIKTAAIWDPDTGVLTKTPAEMYTRVYHSTSVLLADGTVLSGGGGSAGMAQNDYLNAQIYKPPYLFDASGKEATRPVISGAPKEIIPGESFTITVDNAAAISKLTFIKTGATTHTFNMDARSVDLTFTKGPNNTIVVKTPANVNDMTAGSWMLFAWNDKGVPSVAPIIAVEPSVTPYEADGDGGVALGHPLGHSDSLVINGSFEAFQGDLAKNSWTTFANGKVGGWEASTGKIKAWAEGLGMVKTPDGRIVAEIEATTGTLSQKMMTEAGKSYDLKFDFAARPDAVASSKMEVLWNGKVIATITPTDATFKAYSYKVTGTGGADVLAFRPLAGDVDTTGGLLDKVALVAGAVTPPTTDNLIVDGGFEASPAGPGKVGSAWTLTGTGGVDTTAARVAEGGKYFAFDGWGNVHNAALSQTINTVAGQTYTLKLKANVFNSSASTEAHDAQIKMDALNGATAIETKTVAIKSGMAEYSMVFTAASMQTIIKLSDVSPKGQANFDIDVDAVSVMASTMPPSTTVNLIVDGGFEASPAGFGKVGAAWTLAGAGGVDTTVARAAEGGKYFAFDGWANSHDAVLSQTINTIVGHSYSLKLKAGVTGLTTANAQIKMDALNGTTLIKAETVAVKDETTEYSMTFTATSAQTTIRLSDVSPKGQPNFDIDVDAVSVVMASMMHEEKAQLKVSSYPVNSEPGDLKMISAAADYVIDTDKTDRFMGDTVGYLEGYNDADHFAEDAAHQWFQLDSLINPIG